MPETNPQDFLFILKIGKKKSEIPNILSSLIEYPAFFEKKEEGQVWI